MFSLEAVLMIGAIVFCVGGLLGAFISRSIFPPEQQKQLEDNLRASRQELTQYQREVAEHFAQTAQLVEGLTKSYKDVHDHLASGALQLSNPEIAQQIIASGDKTLGISNDDALEAHSADIEPPRDWAPKTAGDDGTLREDYGLDDIATDTEHKEKLEDKA